MRFQYAFTEPQKLMKDAEYSKWIYGILAMHLERKEDMDKITAKGLFGTVEIIMEITKKDEELIFDFNGEEDPSLEPIIQHQLNYAPAMGGTYYPPANSMLNVVNVLQNGCFFTKLISLEIEGEPETIPFDDSDPNIIY